MVLIVATVLSLAAPQPGHMASDVELIAGWLRGDDPAGAFVKPFGDAKNLADCKDALLYTDIPGVQAPAGLKGVAYEFVQSRMQSLRNGRKASPAVLIVRSSFDEPAEDGGAPEVRRKDGEREGRVYYVEVAIGNMAWHWMKVVIRDEDGKPKAAMLWSRES